MNKKLNIFLIVGIVSLFIIGGFFLMNMNKEPSNKFASLDRGDYHYLASNVLEVTKDERIFDAMTTDKDDNLVYMIESAEGCYIYRGFGEEREVLTTDLKSPRDDLDVMAFTIDDKGNIYVLYGVYRGEERVMNIYNKDKKLVESDVDMAGNIRYEIKNMSYFDDKIYLLDHDFNLQVNSIDGKEIDKVTYSGQVLSVDVDRSGNIYMLVWKGIQRHMVKLDYESNQVIFDIQMEIPPQDIIKCSKTNDSIYTSDGKSIYEFDSAGSMVQKEIEFASDVSLAFGAQYDRGVHSLNTLICDNKENFYLFAYGNKSLENNIYMLSKTSGSQPPEKPKQEIVLTASYEQDFIVNAIAQYNLQSEDYKIVLDTAYKSYDEFMNNVQEAGEKLALRIMTNDVGDIVATGGNGLNYYDLLKTDAFMDLNELIKEDKNYDNLNKAVLNGMTLDGKLRGLPLGIAYYKMLYNKDLGDRLDLNLDLHNIKWSEILELAMKLDEEASDITVFNSQERSAETQFILLLQANMPDLIDIENKTVDLKQDWFMNLVSDFKETSKLKNFTQYSEYDYKNLTGDNSIFYFQQLQGRHHEESQNIRNNVHELLRLPAFVGEKNRNSIAFPYIMYSISNNSEHKDVAWDFLSYLLEVATQSLLSLKSHPINLQAEKEIQEYYDIDSTVSEQLGEIINRVDYLYDMSYYKQDILLPIRKYFNNQISLDEAIDEAEHNIWLRLNE